MHSGQKRIRPIRLTVFHAGNAIKTGLVFNRSPIRIGRMLDNDIVVPFRYVSRYHCELRFMRGRWYVVDLGSKNGMYSENEQRAKEVVLDDLTEFRLQDVTILFEVEQDAEEAEFEPRSYRTLDIETTRVETTRSGKKERRGPSPQAASEPTRTHATAKPPEAHDPTLSDVITAKWNIFTEKMSSALDRIGL